MSPIPSHNSANPAKERRRQQRFDLRLPARVEVLSPRQDQVPVILNLLTKDISACGAFFTSEQSIEEGTRVKVDMVLFPKRQRISQMKQALIKVSGTVLRKGPEGLAVNFEKGYKLGPLN